MNLIWMWNPGFLSYCVYSTSFLVFVILDPRQGWSLSYWGSWKQKESALIGFVFSPLLILVPQLSLETGFLPSCNLGSYICWVSHFQMQGSSWILFFFCQTSWLIPSLKLGFPPWSCFHFQLSAFECSTFCTLALWCCRLIFLSRSAVRPRSLFSYFCILTYVKLSSLPCFLSCQMA